MVEIGRIHLVHFRVWCGGNVSYEFVKAGIPILRSAAGRLMYQMNMSVLCPVLVASAYDVKQQEGFLAIERRLKPIEVVALPGHEITSANESPCLNLVASYPFHDYAAFGKPSAYQSAGTS